MKKTKKAKSPKIKKIKTVATKKIKTAGKTVSKKAKTPAQKAVKKSYLFNSRTFLGLTIFVVLILIAVSFRSESVQKYVKDLIFAEIVSEMSLEVAERIPEIDDLKTILEKKSFFMQEFADQYDAVRAALVDLDLKKLPLSINTFFLLEQKYKDLEAGFKDLKENKKTMNELFQKVQSKLKASELILAPVQKILRQVEQSKEAFAGYSSQFDMLTEKFVFVEQIKDCEYVTPDELSKKILKQKEIDDMAFYVDGELYECKNLFTVSSYVKDEAVLNNYLTLIDKLSNPLKLEDNPYTIFCQVDAERTITANSANIFVDYLSKMKTQEGGIIQCSDEEEGGIDIDVEF